MLTNKICQQNVEKTSIDKAFLGKYAQLTLLSPSRQKILAKLIELKKRYKQIVISQTTLGVMVGLGRQVTNESIAELEEIGLIRTIYYGYKKPLGYLLTLGSEEWTIRKYFRSLFANAVLFPVFFLSSQVEATLLNVNCFLKGHINHPSTSQSSPEAEVNCIAGVPQQLWDEKYREYHDLQPGEKVEASIFTTEQLEKIASYPPEAVKHAHSQYAKEKDIRNPYAWYMKVLENWMTRSFHGSDRYSKTNKTPEKGMTKPIDPNRGSTDLSARKVRIQAAAQSKEWYNPKMSLEQMRVRLNDEVYEQQRRDRQEKMGLIDPVKELIEPELASTPFAAQLAQVFTQKTVSHNKRAPMFTDAPYLSEDSVWEEV